MWQVQHLEENKGACQQLSATGMSPTNEGEQKMMCPLQERATKWKETLAQHSELIYKYPLIKQILLNKWNKTYYTCK